MYNYALDFQVLLKGTPQVVSQTPDGAATDMEQFGQILIRMLRTIAAQRINK